MTTFKEIIGETSAFPDKIQAFDYCCGKFKDKFLDQNLQFNINFQDKSMDIQILKRDLVDEKKNIVVHVFTDIKYCMNCGKLITFISDTKK
jgi:hypothetical protein